MRILLDHCLPRRLKQFLPTHNVQTAAEMGWDRLRNGKLLAAAAAQFDVVLTVDQNIKHQQNLAALPIAIVVMLAPTNRLNDLVPCITSVEGVLGTLAPKTLVEVAIS